MGWYLKKSLRFGPLRVNLSKSGIGGSVGVTGLRVGTGPKGPYVQGGRQGLYFRESLRKQRGHQEDEQAGGSAELAANPELSATEDAADQPSGRNQFGVRLIRRLFGILRGR